eukprot:364512-Chlamydomonas_euryale.AAC.6
MHRLSHPQAPIMHHSPLQPFKHDQPGQDSSRPSLCAQHVRPISHVRMRRISHARMPPHMRTPPDAHATPCECRPMRAPPRAHVAPCHATPCACHPMHAPLYARTTLCVSLVASLELGARAPPMWTAPIWQSLRALGVGCVDDHTWPWWRPFPTLPP